jgi:hypothetical protein
MSAILTVAKNGGAAGAANAPLATPDKYLRINIGGTIQKIPLYAD